MNERVESVGSDKEYKTCKICFVQSNTIGFNLEAAQMRLFCILESVIHLLLTLFDSLFLLI